jgi:dCTP deaminase
MILSDVTIKEFIDSGRIIILPEFDPTDIRPAGIRLHLGEDILIPAENQIIDISSDIEVKYEATKIPPEGYVLKSNMFILGSTYESIMTPRDIVCHLEGRSTIARLGLSIHCTSGIIDGNHDEPRSIVLEIKNTGPFHMILKPRIALAMLLFSQLTHPILQKSQSQYKGQSTVLPPNLKYIKNT